MLSLPKAWSSETTAQLSLYSATMVREIKQNLHIVPSDLRFVRKCGAAIANRPEI